MISHLFNLGNSEVLCLSIPNHLLLSFEKALKMVLPTTPIPIIPICIN